MDLELVGTLDFLHYNISYFGKVTMLMTLIMLVFHTKLCNSKS